MGKHPRLPFYHIPGVDAWNMRFAHKKKGAPAGAPFLVSLI